MMVATNWTRRLGASRDEMGRVYTMEAFGCFIMNRGGIRIGGGGGRVGRVGNKYYTGGSRNSHLCSISPNPFSFLPFPYQSCRE